MQASKNISDTWLAHWIMTINTPNATATANVEKEVENTELYAETIKHNIVCLFEKFFTWHKPSDCKFADNSTLQFETDNENMQISLNSFYLAIYIGMAVFNSAIALVRAFMFAYAGIKAAKFIHNRLLNSVFFVSCL